MFGMSRVAGSVTAAKELSSEVSLDLPNSFWWQTSGKGEAWVLSHCWWDSWHPSSIPWREALFAATGWGFSWGVRRQNIAVTPEVHSIGKDQVHPQRIFLETITCDFPKRMWHHVSMWAGTKYCLCFLKQCFFFNFPFLFLFFFCLSRQKSQ